MSILRSLHASPDADMLIQRLSRFITVPMQQDGYDYTLLEDVVSMFREKLFPGESISEWRPIELQN